MSLAQIIQQHVDLLPQHQQSQVLDFVLFLEQKQQCSNRLVPDDSRKKQLAESLSKLAQSSAFKEVADPVAWQKEIRRDRHLLGRDD